MLKYLRFSNPEGQQTRGKEEFAKYPKKIKIKIKSSQNKSNQTINQTNTQTDNPIIQTAAPT